ARIDWPVALLLKYSVTGKNPTASPRFGGFDPAAELRGLNYQGKISGVGAGGGGGDVRKTRPLVILVVAQCDYRVDACGPVYRQQASGGHREGKSPQRDQESRGVEYAGLIGQIG